MPAVPGHLGPLSPMALREQLRFGGSGGRVIDHFRRADTDGSGELNKAEFAKAMIALGFEATQAQIDRTWKHIDVDGDGHVPYSELDSRLRDNSAVALGSLRRRLSMRKKSITWLTRARASLKVKDAQRELLKGGSILFVQDEASLAALSWQQQGNAELNTKEAWEQRLRLRKHPKVEKELNGWWQLALSSARLTRPHATTLSWPDYRSFYASLYKDLLDDEYDEAEAEEAGRPL